MALIDVSFPGGKKVNAHMRGFTIETDQPTYAGGEGSAPTPFDSFLASIATCSGIFALGFCQSKGLNTEGLKVGLDVEVNPNTKLLSQVNIRLELPKDFPDKYRDAIKRSIDLCSVKKTLFDPPTFEIVVQE